MSELGDIFNALREKQREFNRKRHAKSLEKLKEAGIEYTELNHGLHLRIYAHNHRIDFWPTTGRWKTDAGGKMYGVDALIEFCK